MVIFSPSPKKVLRKVCHLKGNEKRNLMTLVSVAQHLHVGSYERLKVLFTVHFEWVTNLEAKSVPYAKLKELQCLKRRLKQSLLGARTSPDFMQIRWTVVEKECRNSFYMHMYV